MRKLEPLEELVWSWRAHELLEGNLRADVAGMHWNAGLLARRWTNA